MGYLNHWHLRLAKNALLRGGVIGYATEAVFGLGCLPLDEQALQRLMFIKRRAPHKGLILVASSVEQLTAFVQPLSPSQCQQITQAQRPTTWLVPCKPGLPYLLTGDHATIAVRVTRHPQVRRLCQLVGSPITSTSANLSGRKAATDLLQMQALAGELDYLLPGQVGGASRPSRIIDLASGRVLRD